MEMIINNDTEKLSKNMKRRRIERLANMNRGMKPLFEKFTQMTEWKIKTLIKQKGRNCFSSNKICW